MTFKVAIRKATLLFFVFVLSFSLYTYTRLLTRSLTTPTAHAATSSTLNFQGRLLAAAGNIVPDGFYNLEFKIYDGGTSGGPAGVGGGAGGVTGLDGYGIAVSGGGRCVVGVDVVGRASFEGIWYSS